MMRKKMLLLLCVIILTISCKDVYHPAIIESASFYLVVEGILNSGSGPSEVRLSRTARLYGNGFAPELNAVVTVEGKDNSISVMPSAGNGYYQSSGLNLIINNEYRLRIKTVNGKEYLSDYVMAKSTPPIDSIIWRQEQEGVRLYVNTHDDLENTHYYHWDYDETWEIRSHFYATVIYAPPVVRDRLPGEEVYSCWKYDSSANILIASSEKLQSDIISEAPLKLIPINTERLTVRYSMLLRQYALDKAAYRFYELMKKNTEDIGNLFSPQPTEMKGNIHNISDPSEPVIGYISASTISQKRIFISNSELSYWHFPQDCIDTIIPNTPLEFQRVFQYGYLYPYDKFYSPSGQVVGYYSSYPQCVDCTKRGGNLNRPSYW